MPESQDKKNGRSKASKRDRLISQGVPLLVCTAIIGFVLFNEMRESLPPPRKPASAKESAPPEEPQGDGEDKGNSKGSGNGGFDGGSEGSGGNKNELTGGNTGVVDQIKKGAEAVKNLIARQLQGSGRGINTSGADPAAVREFVEARREDSAGVQTPLQDVLWGSVVFSGIKCKLADRPDLDITLSIELFYNSKTLSREVSQKQVVLEKAAQQVMSGVEYGAVQNTMLRARLLKAFNNVLESGQLWKVDIKNFDIDKG